METKGQIEEIGGIRGWASLVVYIFHSFSYIVSPTEPGRFSPDNYLFSVWDGPLMVRIFFALSGDALSVSFTRKLNPGMSATVPLKRVLRLSGMGILTLGLNYLAISCGLVKSVEANRIVNSYWLGVALPDNTSGLSVGTDVFYAGLIGMYRGSPRLNSNLWTMPDEFTGSVAVFAIGSVFSRLRFRPVILILAIWLYYHYHMNTALFMFGILLGYCRTRGVFSFCHRVVPLRLFFGLSLIALPVIHRYSYLPMRDVSPATVFAFVCFSMFCIYASKDAIWFFSTRFSNFLGEISFPFYALNLLVTCTLESQLIITLDAAGANVKSVGWGILYAGVSVIVGMLVSWIVRLIEMRYLRVLDKAFALFVDPAAGKCGPPTYQPVGSVGVALPERAQ